jgi:hypothetical protein
MRTSDSVRKVSESDVVTVRELTNTLNPARFPGMSVPSDSLFAIPTMRAAVPADLHFRNGRCDNNARDRHLGSCLPFVLEFLHLLPIVPHDPVAPFAKAKPSQARSAGNSVDA